MATLSSMPLEILEAITQEFGLTDDYQQSQNPVHIYASKGREDLPTYTLLSLSQVSRTLRSIFLPQIWRNVSMFYVADLHKVRKFLEQDRSKLYAPHIRRLVISWPDPEINDFGAELDPEVWSGEGPLGSAKDWAFMDRSAWYRGMHRNELTLWHPEWSTVHVESVLDQELHDPPWTSGPDGRGVVDGVASVDDVQEEVSRLLMCCPTICDLEWNASVLSLSESLGQWNPHQLRSLTVFAESWASKAQFEGDLLCDQHRVESLSLLFEVESIGSDHPLKITTSFLKFTPVTPKDPYGIAFDATESTNAVGERWRCACMAIFDRVCTHASLRTLKLVAWELLRIPQVLALLLSLEDIAYPLDASQQIHHWDSHWGFAYKALARPFDELKQLKQRLRLCTSLPLLHAECKKMLELSSGSPQNSAGPLPAFLPAEVVRVSSLLNQHTFASWILEDLELSERLVLIFQGRLDKQSHIS